jgi:CDP-6-deoxy-D-xylo-4-hexulose-3-dehydrase
LGLNALTDELLQLCEEKGILLIEDVCESHGATFKGTKVGNFGFASNFSFYFAHHISTIEGGMISTNDYEFYQICRALRSHGMAREMSDETYRQKYIDENPMLSKDFIFIHPSHNFRATEINAVLGLSQLPNLDKNNQKRVDNFNHFIKHIDSNKFVTDLDIEGQSNYAFILIMKNKSFKLRDKIESVLVENGIEFRRGLSGGGNQLLQPFIRKNFEIKHEDFPIIEHIHNFSWYIGNHPNLELEKINNLVELINKTEL